VVEAVSIICDGSHEHSPIEGNMKIAGKTCRVSEWAGGYTKELARAMIRGAEKYLKKIYGSHGTYPVDSDSMKAEPPSEYQEHEFKEEDMMNGVDQQEHEEGCRVDNWSDQEIPENLRKKALEDIPTEVRKEVRKMHSGLGHPERQTFLRILKLGGASMEAIEYAKIWECPVCQAKKRPPKPQVATSNTRPFGFNDTIAVDLKYLKDATGQTFVVLHAIDAGTSWHAATLLKTREASHVTRKLFDMWVSHYGPPRLIICDQGGEFQSHFLAFCEDYGIDIKVTGAHAAWQNA
jgi:hypothetical protein